MKTLLTLRHAKSSWKHTGLDDRDRPLNKRGQRQAPDMGKKIYALGLTPDLILCSPAKRARDTAIPVAEKCGYDGDVEVVMDFYPGDVPQFIQTLSNLPVAVQRVMIVAHNPGLEDLLAMLTRHPQALATATLAQVELPIEHWWQLDEDTRGNLIGIWRTEEKSDEDD
jgi:phosphohistidine phosphatase